MGREEIVRTLSTHDLTLAKRKLHAVLDTSGGHRARVGKPRAFTQTCEIVGVNLSL